MTESASLIMTILGALLTWTGTVATLTFWLAGKFRDLEKLVYREQQKLDNKYMALFREHGDRLTVLELQVTGVSSVTGPHHPTPKQNRY